MEVLIASATLRIKGPGTPTEAALVICGGGVVFAAIGWLLVSDFRGARSWWLASTDESLDAIPRVSAALRKVSASLMFGGDADRFAHFRQRIMPKILGWAFLAAGALLISAGLTALLTA
jgi:hypothetical protein